MCRSNDRHLHHFYVGNPVLAWWRVVITYLLGDSQPRCFFRYCVGEPLLQTGEHYSRSNGVVLHGHRRYKGVAL